MQAAIYVENADTLPLPDVPERALWRAVLIAALEDLQSHHDHLRIAAEQWFLESRADEGSFTFVCDCIGLDPSAVLRSLRDRRCGELLKAIPKGNKHQKGDASLLRRPDAAAKAGLSNDQQKEALRVANVPEDDFERAVESDRQAEQDAGEDFDFNCITGAVLSAFYRLRGSPEISSTRLPWILRKQSINLIDGGAHANKLFLGLT